jgi:hypothetical protein
MGSAKDLSQRRFGDSTIGKSDGWVQGSFSLPRRVAVRSFARLLQRFTAVISVGPGPTRSGRACQPVRIAHRQSIRVPCTRVVMPVGRGLEAPRGVRLAKPNPQAPHPAPSISATGWRPSMSRVSAYIPCEFDPVNRQAPRWRRRIVSPAGGPWRKRKDSFKIRIWTPPRVHAIDRTA